MSEPASKEDINELRIATREDINQLRIATSDNINQLRLVLIDREVKSIRWFIATFLGAQIAYFAITLSAVYVLLHNK